MPSVQRAHDDLKNQGVVILAVSLDGNGMTAVRHFLATEPYTMPILVDAGMETARKFGARAVPMTYVVDRQGRIVAGGFGPVDFDDPEFRAYIQALLAQPQG